MDMGGELLEEFSPNSPASADHSKDGKRKTTVNQGILVRSMSTTGKALSKSKSLNVNSKVKVEESRVGKIVSSVQFNIGVALAIFLNSIQVVLKRAGAQRKMT